MRVILLCMICVILTESASLPDEQTLPSLEFVYPTNNSKYSATANLAVQGRLSPPLPLNVDIQIYHVLQDGSVSRLAGVSGIKTNDQGGFAVDIVPPPRGWHPGAIRIRIALADIRQVASEQAITAERLNPQAILAPEYKPLPESSGIVVRAEERGEKPRLVVAGKYFVVRGEFGSPDKEGVKPLVGRSVLGSIKVGNMIADSGATVSLWDPKAKKYWYELQLLSPTDPTEGQLELQIPSLDGGLKKQPPLLIPLSIIANDERTATLR